MEYRDQDKKIRKLVQKIRLIPISTIFVLSTSLIAALTSIGSLGMVWNIQRQTPVPNATPKAITVIKNPRTASIFIDIEGAVEKPGIYEVPANTRFVEALVKADGLSSRADRYFVAKTFNLAKKLLDEDKIYVPFLEEAQETPLRQPASTRGEGFAGQAVNINTASQTELELLPKVGPVTAQKIIQNRPYNDFDELVNKKAMGQKTLELVREIITL